MPYTMVMDENTTVPLSISLSVDRKINLGNFESAGAFVSISGVTAETTEEEIDALIAGNGALAFAKIAASLNEKVKAAREAK